MKKVVAVVLVAGMMFTFAGCKKREEKPQLPPGHPSTEGSMPPTGMPDMPKVDRKIIVPKEVTAKWKGVKILVEDKVAKSSKEYTINVGGEQTVANTTFKVKVLHFLPDFRMGENDITSASDKPNNPAVQVLVKENGKEVWTGWLYSIHPGIHPFQSDKLGLALLSGVSK
jgi:hypothetical protein